MMDEQIANVAEAACIGCIVLNANDGAICSEMNPSDFSIQTYREIFVRLKSVWQENGKVDAVTVSTLPKAQAIIATQCAETVPSLSSWKTYIKTVKENAAKQRAKNIARSISIGELEFEEMQQKANELVTTLNGSSNALSLNAKEGFIGFMHRKNQPKTYIKTSYSLLDKYIPFDKGDFLVIGGRPSSGKTALSVELMSGIAGNGNKVCYFSLETSPEKIIDRVVTSICGLDFGKVKRQMMDDNEWNKTVRCADAIGKLDFEIIQTAGKTVAWIQAESIRRKAVVAIVDYLQLIKSEGKSRYEKTTEISNDLHTFAQSTNTAVIALAQLNRAGANDEPSMENLRDSGSIEQDADAIIILHTNKDTGESKLKIEKNKEGQTGSIYMQFDGLHQQFRLQQQGE